MDRKISVRCDIGQAIDMKNDAINALSKLKDEVHKSDGDGQTKLYIKPGSRNTLAPQPTPSTIKEKINAAIANNSAETRIAARKYIHDQIRGISKDFANEFIKNCRATNDEYGYFERIEYLNPIHNEIELILSSNQAKTGNDIENIISAVQETIAKYVDDLPTNNN